MEAATDYITSMPRVEQERKGCIRTYTGKYVNPLQLRAEDICIEDIAHHLSNLCRYTGACPSFYSVAQHSVLVSRQMAGGLPGLSATLEMAGLLHDAAEAYFNDLASPVKHDPRMAFYREAEHATGRLIFQVFGLDPGLLPLTKAADDIVFQRETASWWTVLGKGSIEPWEPEVARHKFSLTFWDINRRLPR